MEHVCTLIRYGDEVAKVLDQPSPGLRLRPSLRRRVAVGQRAAARTGIARAVPDGRAGEAHR